MKPPQSEVFAGTGATNGLSLAAIFPEWSAAPAKDTNDKAKKREEGKDSAGVKGPAMAVRPNRQDKDRNQQRNKRSDNPAIRPLLLDELCAPPFRGYRGKLCQRGTGAGI